MLFERSHNRITPIGIFGNEKEKLNFCYWSIILLVTRQICFAQVNSEEQIHPSIQHRSESTDQNEETMLGSTRERTSHGDYDRSARNQTIRGERKKKTTLSPEAEKYLEMWNYTLNNFWSANKNISDIVESETDIADFGRIVGGTPINVSEVPFLVAILFKNNLHCSGSLISLSHVLSAAHCFVVIVPSEVLMVDPRHFSIRHGSNFAERGGIKIGVTRIVIHPDFMKAYKIATSRVDLAVLTLSDNVPEGNGIPVKLPKSSEFDLTKMEEAGEPCLVAGWGDTTQYSSSQSRVLRGIVVNLIKFDQCSKIYTNFGIQPTKHVCCYCNKCDACHGDSGGGLFYGDTILGVVSFGVGCASFGVPGVYARVDRHLDFITRAKSNAPRSTGSPFHPICRLTFMYIWRLIVLCFH